MKCQKQWLELAPYFLWQRGPLTYYRFRHLLEEASLPLLAVEEQVLHYRLCAAAVAPVQREQPAMLALAC